MTYPQFSALWLAASEAPALEAYLAEQSGAAAPDALEAIWRMTHGGMKAIRAMLGSTQAAFSMDFLIPKRTIEEWEAGRRNPPAYLAPMLGYCAFSMLPSGGADVPHNH